MMQPETWSNARELAQFLMSSESEAIRGVTLHTPADETALPPLYPHQTEALERLMARPCSTILHLPTGSGKTRIALEFIARTLERDPRTRFLWASYPTTLIRQAMVRLAQFSAKLPPRTPFIWAKSGTRGRNIDGLLKDHAVIFALRGTLAGILSDVWYNRRTSPLRESLIAKTPLVIIYDECHQLGASKLQRGWRVLLRKRPEATPWPRVLGMSATPLPRNPRRRILLRKNLFPITELSPRHPTHPWRMDVSYRVQNASLESLGVLCPVNAYQQRSGFFDLPPAVLDRATWRRPIEEPQAEEANADELLRFSAQFNARVMSHPLVLRFIAGRVATRIEQLGKTLVFLPTIRAANAFFSLLEAHPATAGRVFIVHTRLHELEQDHDPPPVYEALARFHDMGAAPCVMINVGMLTTGFDDPRIRTVVLGRLTYSMNLYWQMIGRGARGPRSGGTEDCTVIDPIRLTRLYPIADGYRPTLTKSNDGLFKDEDAGAGRLDPTLTIVERPHPGFEPGPEDVDESPFDKVTLDEEALTAYEAPATRRKPTPVQEPPVVFSAPSALSAQTSRQLRTAGTHARMWRLAAALEGETLQRVATAFGIPFAGEVEREAAADELMDAVMADGRRGASTFFDAVPAPELRRLVRGLDIPTRVNKKGAFVASLIHDFLLSEPKKAMKALIAPDRLPASASRPGGVYPFLDRRCDKRGLQKLLDKLDQPRSAKNKRILIRRIFETFLWRELNG